jgi:hypothetical protein
LRHEGACADNERELRGAAVTGPYDPENPEPPYGRPPQRPPQYGPQQGGGYPPQQQGGYPQQQQGRPQYGQQPQYPQYTHGQPLAGSYPPGQYGQYSYGEQATMAFAPPPPVKKRRTDGPPAALVNFLGPRIGFRPWPHYGVSLAGIGVVLAIIGVVAWSTDYLTSGIHETVNGASVSTSHRLLGILLSAGVLVGGYLLAWLTRGPLRTAGVASSALALPVLLAYATFDVKRSGLPFQLDVVVLVSIGVWLLTFALAPGARGHAFYLGLAAIATWIYVLYKTNRDAFSVPSLLQRATPLPVLGGGGGHPDFAKVAAVCLAFGGGYYLIAFLLDRFRSPGPGVPLVLAAFLATATGIAAVTPSLHQLGTGILLVGLGFVLGFYGAWYGRRFTAWIWAAAIVLGTLTIVGKEVHNNATKSGVIFLICGAVLVLVGWLLARMLDEEDDDEAEPELTPAGA